MHTIKYISEHRDAIVVALAVVAGIVAELRQGEKKKLRALLLGLVVDAEATFGAGTGSLKLSYVIGELYKLTPALVRALFSERQLEQLVETVLTEAKRKWDSNPALKAIVVGG